MATVHPFSFEDVWRPRTRPEDMRSDLELPTWEEFTSARDRFFANLQAAWELHRDGVREDDDESAG